MGSLSSSSLVTGQPQIEEGGKVDAASIKEKKGFVGVLLLGLAADVSRKDVGQVMRHCIA
jgi:hypothetical protein